MKKELLFKLLSTYELIDEGFNVPFPIRVEIFNLIHNPNIFRARVWVKTTYNVYPTFMNLGKQGEDLHRVHSSDEFNNEITSLIAEEQTFFIGREYDSEIQFLDYIVDRIKKVELENK